MRELIIIGSGPAGYTAAIYAARAGLNPLVLAGALNAGGALMTTTEVENFPGFPAGVLGPDLMGSMEQQARRFGADIVFDDVTAVDLTGPVKVITRADGTEDKARAVIVATGSAYRRLGLPAEDQLSGRGVSWCATCDGFFFAGMDVVVVGGGDSALEEAQFLTRFATKVTVVHRRDTLRASKVMIDRAAANPKIEFRWNAEVVDIHGSEAVHAVTVRDVLSGKRTTVTTAAVFVAIGHTPRSELFTDQLFTDQAGYILTAPTGPLTAHRATATGVAGVFACGDVVDRTYRQAITAAASGCQAALDAQHYLAGA